MVAWIGVAGFIFYFFYDMNSVLWKNKILHAFFAVGCLCILIATGITVSEVCLTGGISDIPDWVFLGAAVFFLAVLLYTLFFALPFEETYQVQDAQRKVYDKGMYALCRHPGVLWFFLFYLCLGLACMPSDMLWQGIVYTVCNAAYVIFQDIWTFPRTFDTYGDYKKTTPFLIPNAKSIKRAFQTRKSIGRKQRDIR